MAASTGSPTNSRPVSALQRKLTKNKLKRGDSGVSTSSAVSAATDGSTISTKTTDTTVTTGTIKCTCGRTLSAESITLKNPIPSPTFQLPSRTLSADSVMMNDTTINENPLLPSPPPPAMPGTAATTDDLPLPAPLASHSPKSRMASPSPTASIDSASPKPSSPTLPLGSLAPPPTAETSPIATQTTTNSDDKITYTTDKKHPKRPKIARNLSSLWKLLDPPELRNNTGVLHNLAVQEAKEVGNRRSGSRGGDGRPQHRRAKSSVDEITLMDTTAQRRYRQ